MVDPATLSITVERAVTIEAPQLDLLLYMEETWGSTAHGAGRTMSRAQAKKRVGGDTLIRDMAARGIVVRAASKSGVAEEAGFAYKDLSTVVDVLHRLDLSRRVATLSPIGNIKG
ncbi:MAG: RtcB family protein [Candidatus Rokubacteria bacterium]|nr:RtcB family protein [Candidatus Rokubacteria bacterium]